MNLILKILFIFSFLYFISKAKKISNEKNKQIQNDNILQNKRIIYDVLYINGCHQSILPQSYRYRVLH